MSVLMESGTESVIPEMSAMLCQNKTTDLTISRVPDSYSCSFKKVGAKKPKSIPVKSLWWLRKPVMSGC